ncbi:hypothetical protein BS47DRAFT_1364386 [Hydnum rufescens UP504]|uniref:Uncharacterized protein n=1 Tax=Hydnum rufescens UP504 TaxID=1448309 RepID=A0A9P6ARN3_9AGAM|nr:hypothetical protein BS47DRAFT_1364386 [Hydnum rufescens UP504]
MVSKVNFLGKLTQVALVEEDDWSDGDVNNGESEFEACDSKDGDDEDTNVSFQESDDAGHRKNSKPKGGSINIPNMEMELLNLEAQDVYNGNQLQDDTISHDKDSEGLNDGPLSLDQKKMCWALWGQYMKAVDFLANRTLEGLDCLNVDEFAAKKDTLLKALHEKTGACDFEQAEEGRCGAVMARNAEMVKRSIALVTFGINEDLGDGHPTSQNCTITGLPELTQALDPFKKDILNSLFDVVQTARAPWYWHQEDQEGYWLGLSGETVSP